MALRPVLKPPRLGRASHTQTAMRNSINEIVIIDIVNTDGPTGLDELVVPKILVRLVPLVFVLSTIWQPITAYGSPAEAQAAVFGVPVYPFL